MEADWEFEIGEGAPVIDAHWPGLVDLRTAPERAAELAESAQQPGLAEALTKLNGANSPVWTTKCDVWPALEFDADELDALSENASHALACYVDLLSCNADTWVDQTAAEAWCRTACARLQAVALRSSRIDLVVRRAVLLADSEGFGITAYLTACGATAEAAAQVLQAALAAFADSVAP